MTEAKDHWGSKIFLLEYEKEEKELILVKALPLRGGKNQKFTITIQPPTASLFPISFALCQKKLGRTLQAVTSRPTAAFKNWGNLAVGSSNYHLH